MLDQNVEFTNFKICKPVATFLQGLNSEPRQPEVIEKKSCHHKGKGWIDFGLDWYQSV